MMGIGDASECNVVWNVHMERVFRSMSIFVHRQQCKHNQKICFQKINGAVKCLLFVVVNKLTSAGNVHHHFSNTK